MIDKTGATEVRASLIDYITEHEDERDALRTTIKALESERDCLSNVCKGHYATIDQLLTENAALRAKLTEQARIAIRIYNSGYKAGHHHTVEGGYSDIAERDMDTYHEEEVSDLLKDVARTEIQDCEARIRATVLAERDAAIARVKEWEEKARNWLATPEASAKLDGYRELAERLNKAEAERDAANIELGKLRLCVTCGKTRDAAISKEVPGCAETEVGHICQFNATPTEAWLHWRDEAHKLRNERDGLSSVCKGHYATIDQLLTENAALLAKLAEAEGDTHLADGEKEKR